MCRGTVEPNADRKAFSECGSILLLNKTVIARDLLGRLEYGSESARKSGASDPPDRLVPNRRDHDFRFLKDNNIKDIR